MRTKTHVDPKKGSWSDGLLVDQFEELAPKYVRMLAHPDKYVFRLAAHPISLCNFQDLCLRRPQGLESQHRCCAEQKIEDEEGVKLRTVWYDGFVDASLLPDLRPIASWRMRVSSKEREQKTAALYDYIGSQRYAQLLASLQSSIDKLEGLDADEKKAHEAVWTKRSRAFQEMERTRGTIVAEVIRTSSSQTGMVDPAMPHHCDTISGSVQSRKTSALGASNKRDKTNDRSLIGVSLGLQHCSHSVETNLPKSAILIEPKVNFLQRRQLQSAGSPLCVLGPCH